MSVSIREGMDTHKEMMRTERSYFRGQVRPVDPIKPTGNQLRNLLRCGCFQTVLYFAGSEKPVGKGNMISSCAEMCREVVIDTRFQMICSFPQAEDVPCGAGKRGTGRQVTEEAHLFPGKPS